MTAPRPAVRRPRYCNSGTDVTATAMSWSKQRRASYEDSEF